MQLQNLIRWTITILLLVVVWKNSHWSVALCLTLQGITLEMIVYKIGGNRK